MSDLTIKERIMMDITVSKCKECIVAIAFCKFRIGEDAMKIACKKICGRDLKKKEEAESDLFQLFQIIE